MYMKYNAVLRAQSKDPFLEKQYKALCGPAPNNTYVTTIHALNSAIIKLSKLTVAGKVWRGVCYGKLPHEFWVPSAEGICGGIEFGFQSTTRERQQAVHYAMGSGYAQEGDPMTIFEIQMGMVRRRRSSPPAPLAPVALTMQATPSLRSRGPRAQSQTRWCALVPDASPSQIDRGAELSWASQYPHEREVLLPPLTGLQVLESTVEGQFLTMDTRLSLNLTAQTLEQVLSRRRKMLMDMARGIELEMKSGETGLKPSLVPMAIKILRTALEFGAMKQEPEWFNDDDKCARARASACNRPRLATSCLRV